MKADSRMKWVEDQISNEEEEMSRNYTYYSFFSIKAKLLKLGQNLLRYSKKENEKCVFLWGGKNWECLHSHGDKGVLEGWE